MISHNYTYEGVLADSMKVQWTVDELIGGDKALDFTKPFLPDALAGVAGIKCLSEGEKLILNQIRGNSYLYLFGFVEEFVLPFVLDQARSAVFGDSNEVRSLINFADEEAKHIELFRRFGEEFRKGFATHCDAIGPAQDVARAILKHGALDSSLAVLHIEWMTQRHYLDSVKASDAERLDPQFLSLLRHHSMEESQHAKIDTMITDRIASASSAEEIAKGIDDYAAIGGMLDGGVCAQVGLDLAALSRATGRTFTEAETEEIRAAQTHAYRYTFLLSGMTHPNFVQALAAISPAGQARIAEMAKVLS